MPFDGSGNFTLTQDFPADRDAGFPASKIQADLMDNVLEDLASGLEQCINRFGENPVAANINWGGFKITNYGNASSAADVPNARQIANNALQYGGTTGGSADAYTLTQSLVGPVQTGTRLLLIANFTNSGAATFNLNGVGAVEIKRKNGDALLASDITSGQFFELAYDGTYYVLFSLSASGGGSGDVSAASNFGTDNVIVRSDGTSKGVQATGISIADTTNNVTGMGTLGCGAITSSGAVLGTQIEVANTDTTITRTDAGAIAVGGVGVALNSTSLPHTASQYEVGNASDTTISRSAAGRIAVEGKDALLKGQTDDLSAGYTSTSVQTTPTNGSTFTPTFAAGNIQDIVNNVAGFTLAAPTGHGSMIIDVVNGASAGTITESGFEKSTGDTRATTNGLKYRLFITSGVAGQHIHTQAMQ